MPIASVSSETPPSVCSLLSRSLLIALLAGVVPSLSSCSTTHYRLSADREVYAIVAAKVPSVPGAPDTFDIAFAGEADLADLPVETARYALLGPEAESEVGADLLSLEGGLRVGCELGR